MALDKQDIGKPNEQDVIMPDKQDLAMPDKQVVIMPDKHDVIQPETQFLKDTVLEDSSQGPNQFEVTYLHFCCFNFKLTSFFCVSLVVYFFIFFI